jgi:hypothetical protein
VKKNNLGPLKKEVSQGASIFKALTSHIKFTAPTLSVDIITRMSTASAGLSRSISVIFSRSPVEIHTAISSAADRRIFAMLG